MTAKVHQGKEKDFESIVPRFDYCDMDEQLRKEVVDLCRDAYKRQHDGEFKYFRDLAMHIKKALDQHKEVPGAWHIVVGKSTLSLLMLGLVGTSFGSFVTYEHKCIAMFWLEHIGFLCYKHG